MGRRGDVPRFQGFVLFFSDSLTYSIVLIILKMKGYDFLPRTYWEVIRVCTVSLDFLRILLLQ